MNDETKQEVLRRMNLIVPRLLDDQPMPAINALRALMVKHGIHATELSFSIDGSDLIGQMEKELDAARSAANRAFSVFEMACKAKGYASAEASAEVLSIDRAYIRDCRDMGKVPAIFFALLAAAPDKGLRERQMRAMLAEAKRRVRAEDARRRAKRREKAKATVVAHASSGSVIRPNELVLHPIG
jgi:hypothetical protein